MTPPELLARLTQLVPGFERAWASPENLSIREDGSFTLHGVCSELTDYFQDHYRELPETRLRTLFAFIEEHVDGPDDITGPNNALCTCFLENIAGEEAGEAAKPFMGKASRRYYDAWSPE